MRKKERIEVVTIIVQRECVEECNSQWLQCAREALMEKSVDGLFADELRHSIIQWRQKI